VNSKLEECNFDGGHIFYAFDSVFGDATNKIKEKKLRSSTTILATITFKPGQLGS
jgi:hypothetical protein